MSPKRELYQSYLDWYHNPDMVNTNHLHRLLMRFYNKDLIRLRSENISFYFPAAYSLINRPIDFENYTFEIAKSRRTTLFVGPDKSKVSDYDLLSIKKRSKYIVATPRTKFWYNPSMLMDNYGRISDMYRYPDGDDVIPELLTNRLINGRYYVIVLVFDYAESQPDDETKSGFPIYNL